LTPVFAEIVAIVSAMGWAIDSVLVRFGLRQSNIFAAMFVSYAVSITCMWGYLVTTTSLGFLKSPAMIYYLISGCLQPIFARALFYEGITRIGVARAGPLRGIEPLFAAAIAVIILNEHPSLQVYAGTILIVASLWLISGKQQHEAKWRYLDALLPISAALISAISQTLRKQALKIVPDPFVAVAMVTTVSLILLLGFVLSTGRREQLRMNRTSLLFFFASALVATSAQVANFIALGRGEMSVIIPLLNTTPLFSVFFSVIFLHNVETVNLRIICGAILMVGGVVLITSR
jgi:drug/metabolite transporter (DMT)-like permease